MIMERYSFNPVAKTLVITAAFAKAMQNFESDEYTLYMKLMADIPNLEVVRKTHASPKKCVSKSTGEKFNCNQFKNLTYKNMETFIMGLPAAEAYMEEYLFLKNYAAEVQTNGYTIIRRWFVAQFPDFRKNPIVYLTNQPAVVSAAEVADQYEAEMATAA
jgi:hypothetical protein